MSTPDIYGLVFMAAAEKNIQNALYLNGFYSPILSDFPAQSLYVQQYFKPSYEQLVMRNIPASALLPALDQRYEAVFIHGTKNVVETRYLIALGLSYLYEDGQIFICAENKAGGSRLGKMLSTAGLSDIDHHCKYKSRVVWGRKDSTILAHDVIATWKAQGRIQDIAGGFRSQPGLFGWDKIDKGSSLLLEHLPLANPKGGSKIFKGKGADFGCGYGFLSRALLERYNTIRTLYCLDADHRAIELCPLNLPESVAEISASWADLTQKTSIASLDFIVMNPPFHEGKKSNQSIGHAFLENAASALKKNGQLWLVANSHLGYEAVLERCFFSVAYVYEGQGFKVFQAIK